MNIRRFGWIQGGVLALFAQVALHAQTNPGLAAAIPAELQVPEGNVLYLRASAKGTQNYVCVPGTAGPGWKFLGPQATLFVKVPFMRGEIAQQVATHFLSMNPDEGGTARATWQSSLDTSAVWGKAVVTVTDPAVVEPNSIPWLLVQIVGTEKGTWGGSAVSETTYIQRINTQGGVAPASGCDASTLGAIALVPYTTEYLFYRMAR